jgi:type I restriction enzyme R subunit
MTTSRHSEAAFETVIETHLLANGYTPVAGGGFDRERAIVPEIVLGFIRETQPKEWAKLEALHGEKTGEQILSDLCKWMDLYGSLATLRHGFKCYGRTLHAACVGTCANSFGAIRNLLARPRGQR